MHKMALGTVAVIFGALAATAAEAGMKLTSAEVSDGATIKNPQVFNSFTCTGDNVSPSLSWSGSPKETKSFVVTVYDPDAPTGSGWWHWVVVNLPASTTSIPKGAGDPKANLLPAGAMQTRTDFGAPGYGGPCPPKGDKPHHYHFTVYALDEDKLGFVQDPNGSGALVGYEVHFHTLAKASLVGTYGRPADKK
jgi:Raf kinase inhibitor-like YbhB/YbcL family protein